MLTSHLDAYMYIGDFCAHDDITTKYLPLAHVRGVMIKYSCKNILPPFQNPGQNTLTLKSTFILSNLSHSVNYKEHAYMYETAY